jgi:hypothetical protein
MHRTDEHFEGCLQIKKHKLNLILKDYSRKYLIND